MPFPAPRLAACALSALAATSTTLPPAPAPAAIHRAAVPNTPAAAGVTVTGTVRDGAGAPVAGAQVVAVGPAVVATTDAQGAYRLALPDVAAGDTVALMVRRIGYGVRRLHVALTGAVVRVDVTLTAETLRLESVVVTGAEAGRRARAAERRSAVQRRAMRKDVDAAGTTADAAPPPPPPPPAEPAPPPPPPLMTRQAGTAVAPVAAAPASAPAPWPGDVRRPHAPGNREQYERIDDNPFLAVASNPRSTFSLDVDRASYANVRRFLTQGVRPPADAVRIEEFVNYFPYAAAAPEGREALAVTAELAPAPWRPAHRLVRVAVQARRTSEAERKPANLVFLVDVSGSMMPPDRLPLVKRALGVLVDRLRPEDRVALVAYAGSAGLVLPSTPGSEKAAIREAIERLEAGGSTAGGAGLALAYRVAREHAGAGVNSRVVLATDGDFNVGVSSDAELERLVEARRADGTYLTVLGFGTGNLQDAKMKKLAKRGNGNYAYVDDLAEARKVFGQELTGTLETVANDAKLQVEFNPAAVRAYRLIGYEGRLLRDEDFNDDAKDAGDVGAGHHVTALYEVVPVGARSDVPVRGVDPLRYGGTGEAPNAAAGRADELVFVKLRYKVPGQSTSRLVTAAARDRDARPSEDFRFASAVAEFGMLLRASPHRGAASAGAVLARARGALGDDPGGHRAEFVRLVGRWEAMERGVAVRE